ncbi:MAG: universal stress protein [Verrucomicrobiaceae bacterium]|nr:universal stress protein [Verrucomicrobiaceae bacterium]
MKNFKNILVGIDFTPSCRNALREAVRRASLDGASVTGVHVMDEFLVHELRAALSTDEAGIRAEWQTRLRKFVDESDLGATQVAVEVRIGHPFAELVDACKSHGADLLVMGAKGSKGGEHRIGAIAAKCVRKAPVDVFVVREDAQGPFKHVVACVDFSENSAKAVQAALHLAGQDRADVDCLYVYQSALALSLDYGGYAPPLPVGPDEDALKIWQEDLDKFVAPLTRSTGGVKVRTLVKERVNIRETILEHVEETKADLVVLGTRGKTGLRELLIGTTAEKIVQHAPCSILAVKPDTIATGAE